jgi:hypothetical protein
MFLFVDFCSSQRVIVVVMRTGDEVAGVE